jgi:hypothetical protein
LRIYRASSEETLRARKLLADWFGEGFLSKAQYQLLERETVSELRTTNIFLRLVLFLFTLISVGAAALFFVVSRPSEQTAGVFRSSLPFCGYRGRRFLPGSIATVSRKRSSFVRLVSCAGCRPLFSAVVLIRRSRTQPVPVPPPASSFALDMALLRALLRIFAAMIFVLFHQATGPRPARPQRLIIAVFYATGLAGVATACATASTTRRGLFGRQKRSSVGIYLTINLQLSSLNPPAQWWGSTRAASEWKVHWGTQLDLVPAANRFCAASTRTASSFGGRGRRHLTRLQ